MGFRNLGDTKTNLPFVCRGYGGFVPDFTQVNKETRLGGIAGMMEFRISKELRPFLP